MSTEMQLFLGTVLIVLAGVHYWLHRHQLPPPPGPPCRLVIGMDRKLVPRSEPWKVYAEWGKIYGGFSRFPSYCTKTAAERARIRENLFISHLGQTGHHPQYFRSRGGAVEQARVNLFRTTRATYGRGLEFGPRSALK